MLFSRRSVYNRHFRLLRAVLTDIGWIETSNFEKKRANKLPFRFCFANLKHQSQTTRVNTVHGWRTWLEKVCSKLTVKVSCKTTVLYYGRSPKHINLTWVLFFCQGIYEVFLQINLCRYKLFIITHHSYFLGLCSKICTTYYLNLI